MSLRINHNISSMNGHRQLTKNNEMMSRSLERLSSGLKINRAADGAAGLVISEQMRAQITGLGQAISNSETAISMVQTTEGALNEVNSLLIKARELTLHAANSGANDSNQRAADQAELDNVIQTITRIADVTQFGTKKLLDGSLNGASTLGTGITRISVGNLANNAGISAGTTTLAVTSGTKEAMSLNKTGATTDAYVFTTAVTGLAMGTNTITAGVTVALTVGTGTVAIVTTGVTTATALAASLNTAVSGLGLGYNVTADGNGAINVQRATVGSSDFTSQITFSKAATALVTGSVETITSSVTVTTGNGTAATAATQIFSAAALSGVTDTTVVATGTFVKYQIDTATGGTFSGSHTVTLGQTMAQVLTSVNTLIQAHATFTGSTVSLVASGVASGLEFKLSRDLDTVATDFNFSLSIDYNNNPNTQSEAHTMLLSSGTYSTGSLANSTFISGGGANVSGVGVAGLLATALLNTGNAMNLTIEGQTVTVSGGQTLASIASGFTTKIQALGGGLSGIEVRFFSGITTLTGGTFAGIQGSTGVSTLGGAGFLAYNANGAQFNITLSVDQAFGVDVVLTDIETVNGAPAGATLNLTTAAQVRSSGVTTIAGIASTTISSTVAGSTVVSGVDTLATLTSANGVVMNLVQTSITASGVATLGLTSGSQALGYKEFSTELTTGLTSAGGSSSFTLGNGALFQVGANGSQLVGLVVSNSSSKELGRGVSTSLSSLEDLLSSSTAALTNGLSSEALKVIDAAIDQITNQRGKLGAFQANTLESGLSSLRVSRENLTAAESTIRDVDFAEESAMFTRNQILVQASTSMLAQANQMPQNVLKLLG
jgi:flagellin